MSELTQGNLISGIRNSKYPGVPCNGIVISARCDLANCKVTKIFYLTALPYDKWLITQRGYDTAMQSNIQNMASSIASILQQNGLDWDSMKYFSQADFATVLNDPDNGLGKKAKQWIDKFKLYLKYTSDVLTTEERLEIIHTEKKGITSFFKTLMNGSNSHYVFIPQSAYVEGGVPSCGLIVDLQELDYFEWDTAQLLMKNEMDIRSTSLTSEDKERYDKKFFLQDYPGYALVETCIKSPWIEYLMQHFSSLFCRIGVDNPDETEIGLMLDNLDLS